MGRIDVELEIGNPLPITIFVTSIHHIFFVIPNYYFPLRQ